MANRPQLTRQARSRSHTALLPMLQPLPKEALSLPWCPLRKSSIFRGLFNPLILKDRLPLQVSDLY